MTPQDREEEQSEQSFIVSDKALHAQGYEVIGIPMQLWDCRDPEAGSGVLRW